ncbi:hypothetical protein SALBM217S_00757 [Streptomyces griseoloalbus]
MTSPLSDDVTIHETQNQKMREVSSFEVPANGSLDLERGGNHIMFMKLKQKPKQGEKVSGRCIEKRPTPSRSTCR